MIQNFGRAPLVVSQDAQPRRALSVRHPSTASHQPLVRPGSVCDCKKRGHPEQVRISRLVPVMQMRDALQAVGRVVGSRDVPLLRRARVRGRRWRVSPRRRGSAGV